MLRKFHKRRESRKQIKRLEEISYTFSTLERLETSGLIHWDAKVRRLFISEPVATLMLARGAQGWTNFLNNVFLYVSYRLQTERWNNHLAVLQAREIAKAKKLTPELTPAELRRIKSSVADKMSEDEVQLPKLETFEFYVVSDDGTSAPQQCGVYDPKTERFDIVNWDAFVQVTK